MPFEVKDTGPEPFIRQKPQKKRRTIETVAAPTAHSRPRTAGGGLGCALAGLVVVTVIVLIGAGLFLPPFSLGERLFGTPYAPLSAQSSSVSSDGLSVTVDPANPGSGFGVRLRAIPPDVFMGKTAANPDAAAWIRATRAALPSTLTLVGPVYQIEKQGTAPVSFTVSVAIPQGVDVTRLDLYRFDVAANRWQFVAAHLSPDGKALTASVTAAPERLALFQASRLAPVISTVIDVGQQPTPGIIEVSNIIHPSGLQPMAAGTLQGALPAGIELGRSYAVIPVIRNFSNPAAIDVATVTSLLQNTALRAVHIQQLVEFASSKPYQGLAIDYRRLNADLRDSFTAFVTALAQKLHNANLTLTVVVPFPTQGGSGFDTGAYDWRAIGAAADSVEILLPLDPQTFVDKGLVDSVLQWAVGEVNRARLQIAVSALSVQNNGGVFTPISDADALAPLGQVAVKPGGVVQPGASVEAFLTGYAAQFAPLDSSNTPSIKYFAPDGTLASTMWLTTAPVIRSRLGRVASYNLAGVVAIDLASPGASADAVGVMVTYKVNQPADVKPGPLELLWTVRSQDVLIAQATGAPGTPFVFTPDANHNNLALAAELPQARRTLGPVLLQVVSPSPSPTIKPTNTPPPTSTPRPTGTKVAAKPAAPAVGGHIAGSFELGGQVQDLNGGTIAAMQRAGMKWVKRQAQMGDGGAVGLIGQAHGAGFKILLSVVGDKNAVTDAGYQGNYAAYVGGLAAQGADAIEIWNEMNIDREWQTGAINPASYVSLLSKSYSAIKAANGSTLVISGALAPTGAEAAFGTDRVWNDDRYYAGLANANAGQYADCIGVHYNEGIVSPTQVGGDPRDSYPTRYFSTMLNRAIGPFNGKPACFTELGYLTPEGYGPLPGGFAWAQNVSVAQQAAWLAQAAVAASSGGRVRLMVVFNVDFAYYGADPQAGYAIIRPGGSCPACDTLGQVSR